ALSSLSLPLVSAFRSNSRRLFAYIFFFLTDPPTTDIYTLSLHDALPIYQCADVPAVLEAILAVLLVQRRHVHAALRDQIIVDHRSEEHTSELQSRENLVCRLLLEKKKTTEITTEIA